MSDNFLAQIRKDAKAVRYEARRLAGPDSPHGSHVVIDTKTGAIVSRHYRPSAAIRNAIRLNMEKK